MFGINGLDELKYAIFENSVPKADIGVEPSIETFQKNTVAVTKQAARKLVDPARLEQVRPGCDAVPVLPLGAHCRAIELGQFAQGVIASVWNPLACMLIGCADVDQDGARVDKAFGFDRADCWQAHIHSSLFGSR
jgi:hypothetical protein